MNTKTFVIGAVLAATLIAGIFATTPMAAYAEDDDDYGDSSETNTEQKIKQSNEGGVGSSQFNCGQNNIGGEESVAEIDVDLCGTVDISVLEEILGTVG
jgi:hypothetical protein